MDYIHNYTTSTGTSYPKYPFFYQCFYNQEMISQSQKSDEVIIKEMAHKCIDKAEKHQSNFLKN